MKPNRMKTVVLGCVAGLVLTVTAIAAAADKSEVSAFKDEKTMEEMLKKSIQYYEAAFVSFNEDNLARAKKNIDKCIELDPGNPDAQDLSVKIAARMNTGGDQVMMAKAASSATVPDKKADKALKLFADARENFEQGDLKRAQKYLTQALEQDPELPGAQELGQKISDGLAQSAATAKKSTETLVAPTESEPAVSQKHSRRWFLRARRAYRNRDIPRAIAHGSRSLQFDPANTAADVLLQRLKTLQARLDIIERDMNEGFVARAAKCLSDQNPFEAVWWLTRAARIAPDDAAVEELKQTASREARTYRPEITSPPARRRIAAVAKKFTNGDYVGAERIARLLQYDFPKTRPLVIIAQDHLLDQTNDERAESEYIKALKQAVDGQFDNALVTVKGALFFDPQHFPARSLLAQVEFELADPYMPGSY